MIPKITRHMTITERETAVIIPPVKTCPGRSVPCARKERKKQIVNQTNGPSGFRHHATVVSYASSH